MWGGARIRSRLSPGQHETALYPAKCSAPTAHNERSITQPLTSECAPLGTPAHLGRSSAVSARFGDRGGSSPVDRRADKLRTLTQRGEAEPAQIITVEPVRIVIPIAPQMGRPTGSSSGSTSGFVRVPSLVGGNRRSRVTRRARPQRGPHLRPWCFYELRGCLLGVLRSGPLTLVCWEVPGRQGEQVPVHNGWQPKRARGGRS